MERSDVWTAIDNHRRALAHLLEGLSEEEWRRASLCEGWTIRLVADDAPWAAGQGQEVCGPIGALLLLLTSRPAALPQLSGSGAAGLHALLTPSPAA
jgi:hypothetical protein